jgi:hypothetical protein
MRYPVGLPIPAQMWRLARDEGGRRLLSLRLGSSEDGRRFTLRLAGGARIGRLRAILDGVIAGTVPAGAATLYRVRAQGSDHRPEVAPKYQLMVRLPVELPVSTGHRERAGTLHVETQPDCLLVARLEDRIWREWGEHLRRTIISHQQQLQRLSDDLKAERRRPRRNREGITGRMGELAERHHRRIRSCLHEVASHLVGFAGRQRVETVSYDDRERDFCTPFPWDELRRRLTEKCEIGGIKLVLVAKGEIASVASGEMPGEFAGALAEESVS